MFDLNLVTSHLSSQLAMLRRARELGMPIRRIELGNEFYSHAPLVDRAIPTPEAYGRKATRWIKAIKSRFPRAQVAAVGLGSSLWWPPRTRRGQWDPGVLSTLRGEDALTFHTYWKPPRGRPSGKRLSQVLAAPLRRFFELRSGGLRRLPDGVVAWVTEWNVWHGSKLRGTWANGLSDAEYLLALLGEPRVRQEDLHALIYRQPFAALFANANGFGARAGDRSVRAHGGGERARRALSAAVGRPPGASAHGAGRSRAFTGPDSRPYRRWRSRAAGPCCSTSPGTGIASGWPTGRACDGTLDSIWARPAARITGHAGEVSHRAVEVRGPLSLPRYSVNRLDC